MNIIQFGRESLLLLVPKTYREKLLGLMPYQKRLWKRVQPPLALPLAMYFSPCCSVHTFGMVEPINIAFLSREGKVLRREKNVSPLRVKTCLQASAVIEWLSREEVEPEAIEACAHTMAIHDEYK